MPITTPPPAPNPLGTNFAAEALAFTQWMQAAAPEFNTAVNDANAAVGDAEQAVLDAAAQVGLATTQAGNASSSASTASGHAIAADNARAAAVIAKDAAEDARDMSQTYAALAGASAGLPALAGQALKQLQVKADESGVQWVVPPTESVPPGVVVFVAASAPPNGYLKANGALISRITYSSLFAAIGTVFGAGDGSTTFKLPDLRGEFVRGWDDARAIDSGRSFGSSQSDQFPSHQHSYLIGMGGSGDGSTPGGTVQTGISSQSTGSAGAGTETRPRNIALLACIKY